MIVLSFLKRSINLKKTIDKYETIIIDIRIVSLHSYLSSLI